MRACDVVDQQQEREEENCITNHMGGDREEAQQIKTEQQNLTRETTKTVDKHENLETKK